LQPLSLIALVHVRNAIISVRENDCKRNLACATISKKKRYAVTQTMMLNHWRDHFLIASAQLEKNDPIKMRRSRSDRKRSPYVSRYRAVFVILGQLLVDSLSCPRRKSDAGRLKKHLRRRKFLQQD
jgi:hypothetical protein